MSLGRPWWLAGLLLLAPLVLLHLRQPRAGLREVPSLLLWERLAAPAASSDRRLRRPRHPLLLALQALALIAMVLALADPGRTGVAPPAHRVFVLDDSVWMGADSRMADARSAVARLAARSPGDRIDVVAAGGVPRIVYSGPAGGVGDALSGLQPVAAPADLRSALAVAGGLLADGRGTVTVLRAPEDAMPRAVSSGRQLAQLAVGRPVADQGLFDASARCGIGSAAGCALFATVRNTRGRRVVDRYTASVGGRVVLTRSVAVPGHGSAVIALSAAPGTRVELALAGGDGLPADDRAFVDVPGAAGAPPSSTVTLVGDPQQALPLARAFAAVPGVTLRLRTAATYRPDDGAESVLVVVEGALPRSGVPRSPAVMLVHPATVPGTRASGSLPTAPVTGAADGDPLLQGVDLSSLSVEAGAARGYPLPGWMRPIVWSGDNPLLAAGDNGRQRVGLLAFDPDRSDLPQLSALPVLSRNVVAWAAGWAPSEPAAGTPLRVDASPSSTRTTISGHGGRLTPAAGGAPLAFAPLTPGAYDVAQAGQGTTRHAALAANLRSPSDAATGPVDLAAWSRVAPGRTVHSLWRWLAAIAAAAVAAEWLLWRRLTR
jgi:hypothetical protein